jgi:hypothetical protein
LLGFCGGDIGVLRKNSIQCGGVIDRSSGPIVYAAAASLPSSLNIV